MSARENLLDRMQQAIAEILPPGLDQADGARQGAAEKILRARRTIGRVAGNAAMAVGIAGGEQHVVGHVLQERGVQHRGFLEGQWRDQPRLGAAWCRRFGHEGDTAARRRRCR